MKGWQITAPNTLAEDNFTEVFDSVSSAKIKITKALVNENDIIAYSGDKNADYPVITGSFGAGIVVETGENCFGLEKNDRVYVNPFTNCQTCYSCKSNMPGCCSEMKIAGENAPGFLRDFAIFPCSSVYDLPDNVSDADAVFIEYVSLAISVIDRLEIKKGDHIAVIGANTLGNILSQIIIYYQGVPILIDNNSENLEKAKEAGVYYVLNVDHELQKNVSELTSGRMADKVVFTCPPAIETKLPLQLASYGSSIAFAGFDYSNLTINLKPAMKRQLNICTVTKGFGNTAASINLLANKAVNLSAVPKIFAEYQDVPSLYEQMSSSYKERKNFLPALVNLM